MHEGKARFSVQRLRFHAQLAEVVEDVRFKAFKPRLHGLVVLRLYAEGEVFAFDEAVVAALELALEHGAVLGAYAVVGVAAQGYDDALAVRLLIRGHIYERELKAHRGVKVAEELAPAVKDGVLVLVLRELVVYVLELQGLGIKIALHAADTVGEHPLKGYTVLCGNDICRALGGGYGRAYLTPLAVIKFCERFDAPPITIYLGLRYGSGRAFFHIVPKLLL